MSKAYPLLRSALQQPGKRKLLLRFVSIAASFLCIAPAARAQSFLPPVSYNVGVGPANIATGDLNGDGHLDLVVLNSGNIDGNFLAESSISILLGNGDGTFQPAVSFPVSAICMALADLNGDGKLDLVLAGDFTGVNVLLGNGDGTFQPAVNYDATNPLFFEMPASILVGDFNGDGHPDLLVTEWFEHMSYSFVVLLGKGDGTFPTKVIPGVGALGDLYPGFGNNHVSIGDFNGDGKLDVVVTNSLSEEHLPATIDVFLGNGDGTFQPAKSYNSGGGSMSVVADFNGDGHLDLAINGAAIWLGKGDGTFQPPVSYPAGGGNLATGDFDRDGKLDLVSRGSTLTVLLGNGDGTFQPAVNVGNLDTFGSPVVGDFNGDGYPDVAVTRRASMSDSTNLVIVFINDSAAPTHFSVNAPASAVAGSSFGITVTAREQSNNTTIAYSGSVHFTSTDSAANLPADSKLTKGTGNFNVILRTAGSQTVLATDTMNGSIVGSSTVTVNPAAANHLAVSTPTDAISGGSFSVTVTAQDQFNNTATGYLGTIHFTASDGSATLPSDYAFLNGDNGAHLFTVTLATTGNQTVTATDIVTQSIAGTSGSIYVSGTTATSIGLSSSVNPSIFRQPFTLTATVSPNTGPTGTVTFMDGGNVLGTGPVNSGQATLVLNGLPAGMQAITAVYNGDATYSFSTSAPLTQNRSPAPRKLPRP